MIRKYQLSGVYRWVGKYCFFILKAFWELYVCERSNCTCVRGEENVLDTISVNWCFSL